MDLSTSKIDTTAIGDIDTPSLDRVTTFIFGSLFLASTLSILNAGGLYMFGFDTANFLATQIGSIANLTVNYGHIAAAFSIVAVYFGNNAKITEFSNHQSTIGLATLASVFVTVISPDLVTYLADSTGRAAFFVLLQTLGFVAIAEHSELAGDKN